MSQEIVGKRKKYHRKLFVPLALFHKAVCIRITNMYTNVISSVYMVSDTPCDTYTSVPVSQTLTKHQWTHGALVRLEKPLHRSIRHGKF